MKKIIIAILMVVVLVFSVAYVYGKNILVPDDVVDNVKNDYNGRSYAYSVYIAQAVKEGKVTFLTDVNTGEYIMLYRGNTYVVQDWTPYNGFVYLGEQDYANIINMIKPID